VEDVLSEDRQQRDRTAQQHREEIERNRPQQDLSLPDIMKARQQYVDRGGALFHPAGPHRKHRNKNEIAGQRDQREEKNGTRPADASSQGQRK